MTSVSRSEHDDETAEGTGAGATETRESQSEPSAATPVRPARSPRSTAPKTAAAKTAAAKKSAAPKTAAEKAAAAKTAAAKSADSKPAAKSAATRRAAVAPATEGPATATDGETAAPPASKRTAASRTASAKAAAARGEAAKTARAPRASAAKSQAASSSRAATAASTRQAQRVAAALTTETTAAERPTRKAPEAAAATVSEPSNPRSEIDEQTVERLPKRAAVTAPEVAAAAVVADATPTAIEVVEPAESPVETVAPAETPVAETSAAPASAKTAAPSGSAAQAVAVIAAPKKSSARKKRMLRPARTGPGPDAPKVLVIDGLVKRFGENTAVDGITLEVRAGSFFGLVGPNGAGKTTTLSMATGLLRPDAGTVRVHDIDVWANPRAAKRATGVLPDRLRLFDRLTGAQLLYYSGVLRGLDGRTVRERSADLIAAFGLDDAVDRLVADYSAGMTKKIALACAMIHSPRLLVLDEPFESVDPVSAANLTEILERYVAGGGTVVLSSHGMDLIERVCDSAAIIVAGRVLAAGTLDEVRAGQTLEDRFVELAGGRKAAEGMEWLHSFSD